ncbi:hypothetical protein CKA32_000853 [Geitlerinema sp. FC II]|nr:hypothetical protein CKA32_000853 [Geitlerinema sp. FC II]
MGIAHRPLHLESFRSNCVSPNRKTLHQKETLPAENVSLLKYSKISREQSVFRGRLYRLR